MQHPLPTATEEIGSDKHVSHQTVNFTLSCRQYTDLIAVCIGTTVIAVSLHAANQIKIGE